MSAVRKKRKVVSLKKTSAYSNYKKQAKKKNQKPQENFSANKKQAKSAACLIAFSSIGVAP